MKLITSWLLFLSVDIVHPKWFIVEQDILRYMKVLKRIKRASELSIRKKFNLIHFSAR